MMNELKLLKENPFASNARLSQYGDTIYFIAADIMSIFGFEEIDETLKKYCKDFQRTYIKDTQNEHSYITLLGIGDVFRLSQISTYPEAARFKNFVLNDIRKQAIINKTLGPLLEYPDFLLAIAEYERAL